MDNDIYKKEVSALRKSGKIPKHLAVIMDGNGRWARKKGMDRINGHNEGVNSARDTIEFCNDTGVEHLTLYVFSKENWNRPEFEVNFLMSLLVSTIAKEIESLMEKNVIVKTIGRTDTLPEKAKKSLEEVIAQTSGNTGMSLHLAISYSGRQEIIDAINKILSSDKENITEDDLSTYLYAGKIPDPQLLIRTGGEMRVSNFLLWQIAYTEFYITEKFWPEFRKPDLIEAFKTYQKRERRFGKTSEQIKGE